MYSVLKTVISNVFLVFFFFWLFQMGEYWLEAEIFENGNLAMDYTSKTRQQLLLV